MKILFVSPHPDDETLGCGGTILNHKKKRDKIYWHILTSIEENDEYFLKRKKEIQKVKKYYKFDEVIQENFITGNLDTYPKKNIISKIEKLIKRIKPDMIYLPYEYDFHSDHKIVFECYKPFFKSFRYPFIKTIKQYEVLSETNLANIKNKIFAPNNFVDITKSLKKKITIMKMYKSEIKKFPFPRSKDTIEALAKTRGSQINVKYAEAFIILKHVEV